MRGSTLGDDADGPTAVTLEPARPHELAPPIAAAYGLTERERVVTGRRAGPLTDAIAGRLYSRRGRSRTTQGILEKVGVGTRGELVARLFFDHYAPRLTDGA